MGPCRRTCAAGGRRLEEAMSWVSAAVGVSLSAIRWVAACRAWQLCAAADGRRYASQRVEAHADFLLAHRREPTYATKSAIVCRVREARGCRHR